MMAYQAIYRKWRPQVFEDIVGQGHITNTLKNQIVNDRISHAYLFCGTRGTGKTTAAKVLSKAVNCLNPLDGSPCNKCEICRGISDGSILDVTEIDAASNNGVDNIRELREDVNFVATQTKYRVYIIDEVHMLSTGAFNALLKTLEEPPQHVIFILATTEVHKIPETILSRCQRFDFKRISPSDIIIRMKEIATADGVEITEDAYTLLAQLADGSMRDGLSILERCVSASGNKISRENIVNVLGMVENEILFSIADSIISTDTLVAMQNIEMLSKEGKNLNVFCDSLITHFRDLLFCKISESPAKLLNYSDDMIVKLTHQAKRASYEKLSNAATVLSKAKADAKWVKNPRIIYELALLKLTRPELDDSNEALLDRLSSIEEKAKNGIVIEKKEEVKPVEVKKKIEVSSRLFAPIDVSTLNSESKIVKIAKGWEKTAQKIGNKYNYISGLIVNRNVTVDGEGLLLLFNKNEAASKSLAVKFIDVLQKAFAEATGTDYKIKPVFKSDIEDLMIDIWNLPNGNKTLSQSEIIKADANKEDSFDNLLTNYPEIIEIQEEKSHESIESRQQEIFEEDEREEFLEDDELSNNDEENF